MEKDWKFIIEDSDAKVIVCANMRIYDIVKNYIGKVGKVQHVFVFDVPEGTPNAETFSYQALLAKVADRKFFIQLFLFFQFHFISKLLITFCLFTCFLTCSITRDCCCTYQYQHYTR